jgi:hypothetical protein
MKELFAQLWKFILEGLKKLDWKKVVYSACKTTFLPMLKKLAESTSSKIDDAIYIGLERLVEVFLAPDTPKIEGPAPEKVAA